MSDRARIDAVIASLEAQRATLGDAAVDFAIQALREKLDDAESAQSTTRKLRQVSVMFCDVVGSTAMLQPLPEEDSLDVLDAALARFASIIQAEGGRVLRFTGDGMKVAFGGERTREDDAVRAVRAGLAILHAGQLHAQRVRDEYGAAFDVRVGINTGPVLLGGGVEADRTMMGHAVHVAARLEQAASPGELCISHSTWLPVRGQFDVVELPPVTVKGADAPQRIYRVLAERPGKASAGRGNPSGRDTPLIGRDEELASLVGRAQHAFDAEQPGLAMVVGDAGIGKTRLVREFEQAFGAGTVKTITARVHAGGEMQPYGVLRDLVANWLHITNDEGIDSARSKLVSGIAALAQHDAMSDAHFVGRLIGIDFPGSVELARAEGRRLRDGAFRALRASLRTLAAQQPLLILVDDLHWADDDSLDFLRRLVEGEGAAALMVVATTRPALRERRPAWIGATGPLWWIELQPLASEQARQLIDALVERLPLDRPELVGVLVDRAAGNPYFLEELVHMVADDGIAAVQPGNAPGTPVRKRRIPETLVGVLQARLDALPTPALEALQQASIVGPVFWPSALPAEVAQALPELEHRAMVQPRSQSAFSGTAEYAFHHPLLHEVTYATVLKLQRREGHARIAAWLSERLVGRESEFLYITGSHYEHAGDAGRAFDCFERATLEAFLRFAHAATLAAIERALAQPVEIDPERRYRLLNRRQVVADRVSHVQLSHDSLDEMERLAEENDSDAQRADVLVSRALQADREGKPADARRLAERAAHLAEIADSPVSACLAHGELAWLAITHADHAAAERHLAAAWPWARRADVMPRESRSSTNYLEQLAFVQVESLRGQQRLVEAAAVLDGLNPGMGIERLSLLNNRSVIALELGDVDGAESRARAMLDLARRLEVPRYAGSALGCLATVAELRGDARTQLELAREMAAVVAKTGYRLGAARALEREGAALLALNELDQARALLTEAEDSYREQARLLEALGARGRRVDLECAAGDLVAALRHVDAILADPAADNMPIQCMVRCWNALHRGGDARAGSVLATLHRRLQQRLSQLADEPSRQRLMAGLPHADAVGRALAAVGAAVDR